MIGWPLIGFAAAFRFSSQAGFIGTAAVTLQILCFFAGFITHHRHQTLLPPRQRLNHTAPTLPA